MIVAALALAGIFISLYLTLFKLGVIGELTCSIGSCETVNTSKWSTFLHLPVAAWGLLFYAEVFVISLVGTMPRFENEPILSVLLVAEAAFGVLFSAWLTYLELAVIHANLHLVRHVSSHRPGDTAGQYRGFEGGPRCARHPLKTA